MKLSPKIARYFDAWIKVPTWYTGHASDMDRFFKFVKAVIRHSRKRPGEATVRKLILAEGRLHAPALRKKAAYFSGLYADILEFSDVVFPDPLTEKSNIHRFYFALESEIGAQSKLEIEVMMASQWGKEWRSKLKAEQARIT